MKLLSSTNVHCRRRKIRCLIAPDYTQRCCQNCVRLRKDCRFYRVHQNLSAEKKGALSPKLVPNFSEHSATIPPTSLNPEPMNMLYPCGPFLLEDYASPHQNTSAGYPSMDLKTNRSSGFSKPPAIGIGDPSSENAPIPEPIAPMAVDEAHITTRLDSLDYGALPLALSFDLSHPGACTVAGEAPFMHLESFVPGPGSEPWPVPFSPRTTESPRLCDMNLGLSSRFQPSVPLDPNWWPKSPAQSPARQSDTLHNISSPLFQ